jgi:hypothetical protein
MTWHGRHSLTLRAAAWLSMTTWHCTADHSAQQTGCPAAAAASRAPTGQSQQQKNTTTPCRTQATPCAQCVSMHAAVDAAASHSPVPHASTAQQLLQPATCRSGMCWPADVQRHHKVTAATAAATTEAAATAGSSVQTHSRYSSSKAQAAMRAQAAAQKLRTHVQAPSCSHLLLPLPVLLELLSTVQPAMAAPHVTTDSDTSWLLHAVAAESAQ